MDASPTCATAVSTVLGVVVHVWVIVFSDSLAVAFEILLFELAAWLELRSPALRASASASEMTQKIGRVQVGMQATHALRMVSHVAKKAYMDAFKLVVFGGVTSVAPGAAAEEEEGGEAKVSTTIINGGKDE